MMTRAATSKSSRAGGASSRRQLAALAAFGLNHHLSKVRRDPLAEAIREPLPRHRADGLAPYGWRRHLLLSAVLTRAEIGHALQLAAHAMCLDIVSERGFVRVLMSRRVVGYA